MPGSESGAGAVPTRCRACCWTTGQPSPLGHAPSQSTATTKMASRAPAVNAAAQTSRDETSSRRLAEMVNIAALPPTEGDGIIMCSTSAPCWLPEQAIERQQPGRSQANRQRQADQHDRQPLVIERSSTAGSTRYATGPAWRRYYRERDERP